MVTAITSMPNGPPAKSGFDQRGNVTEVLCPFQLQERAKIQLKMKQILYLRMDSSRFYFVMPNKSVISP